MKYGEKRKPKIRVGALKNILLTPLETGKAKKKKKQAQKNKTAFGRQGCEASKVSEQKKPQGQFVCTHCRTWLCDYSASL